jgi:maltooligosyltrehalose trehalohydrolase
VSYLENHDQVANSAYGKRLHYLTSPAIHRAMTAWLLLGPATPMLFQGQEFSSSAPFLYFADHKADLAEAVGRGRVEFLAQFPSLTDDRVVRELAPPDSDATFQCCKLDLRERIRHAEAYALHTDLLALRRHDPVLAHAGMRRPEGAVLGAAAFLLRYIDAERGDRLLIVNLGADLDFSPAREPLLAPAIDTRWRLVWHSEAPAYGGQGVAPLDPDGPWLMPGGTAMFFAPEQR